MEEEITFSQVKILGKGYLADGIFVPEDEGNRHYQAIKKWIENGGIVADEFTIDEIRDKKISQIKSEAGSRIVSAYSDIKQRNILMSQDASQINDMNIFIQNIKDQSNLLEAEIFDMDLDQLNNFDPASDDNWI
jgi:hypothetical protein